MPATVLATAASALTLWQIAGADDAEHVSPYSTTGSYAEGTSLVSGRLITPVGRRTTTGDFPAIADDSMTSARQWPRC